MWSRISLNADTFYVVLSTETFRHYHKIYHTETDHSIISSNIKVPKQTFTDNGPAWQVLKNKGFHFGHLNIKSILPKTEQPWSLLISSNISALGITETKLDSTINNEVKTDGYNLIRSGRNRKRGGIVYYIKSNISFNHHGSLYENFENILINIMFLKYKPITLGIIYRLPYQLSFIDDFNIALKELAPQGNETYFLWYLNLFFKGHYVFKKTCTKFMEAQSNHRLLKPYSEIRSAFGLTQMINKATRSTLKTSSLLDNYLTNSKESVTQHGVIILGTWDHDFIFCTGEIKYFKLHKDNIVSGRAYKNYSKKLLKERLHKWYEHHKWDIINNQYSQKRKYKTMVW